MGAQGPSRNLRTRSVAGRLGAGKCCGNVSHEYVARTVMPFGLYCSLVAAR